MTWEIKEGEAGLHEGVGENNAKHERFSGWGVSLLKLLYNILSEHYEQKIISQRVQTYYGQRCLIRTAFTSHPL